MANIRNDAEIFDVRAGRLHNVDRWGKRCGLNYYFSTLL
ncbi:hypothetical protein MuYL_1521 [Mucilaginibacter xinganensis]|uniref:Uncharacterized protein n=1 Tax=Mucilaginibacter xinganensis TaxID=1234841 RepID=A0A223NU44_9SPHI|nr:hypothetical protein MuYL_1521 [Mucilaginibacter xinganensis]